VLNRKEVSVICLRAVDRQTGENSKTFDFGHVLGYTLMGKRAVRLAEG
jgi:hypothetical protein